MATIIYFTNLASDVSGYKLALVNERNPSPPSAVATAVTTTTNSGDNIQMTLTEGGTVAKWITKPLKEAVSINSTIVPNMWGLESNADDNAGFSMRVAEYTTTQGSDLLDSDNGTELAATAGVNKWVTGAITTTTFDAGSRVVLLPYIAAVGGTMTTGTATFNFDGATDDADGDSYVIFPENLRVDEAQIGSGNSPTITGVGVSYFYDLAHTVQDAIDRDLIASNATAQTIIDEANAQKELV